MKLYEGILRILDERGPLPFSFIYNEARNLFNSNETAFDPGEVQNAVARKRDLFLINNEIVSIHPDKDLLQVHVFAEMPGKPACQCIINFEKERFVYTEWLDNGFPNHSPKHFPGTFGDIRLFKAAVYKLAIWDWEQTYITGEGIILNGNSWFVHIKTKTTEYKVSGHNGYPENWQSLCRALHVLTGSPYW
ncbi:hypothetical protein [Bacillus sp. EB01]|uniref:hypothetical protein n=1 Tax=Bacillus sp. EB01 TaxID=1347086 RepID=UPI0005C71955|nr:hypothetical protein [Bacillus sp. EB01]